MNDTNREADTGPRELTIDGEAITLERPRGRKVSVALALLRALGAKWPRIVNRWADYEADYERRHVLELDRGQAMLRYSARPAIDDDGELIYYPETVDAGDGQTRPHPHAGEVVMLPSPLEGMTEEAWAAAGHKLRMPRSPHWGQVLAAVLPEALGDNEDDLVDAAEVELDDKSDPVAGVERDVYRLLALFVMPNGDVKRYRNDGTLKQRLGEQADELLDNAYADELLELGVAVGELIDDQLGAKVRLLRKSGRLGNLLRLAGIDPDRASRQTAEEGPQTTEEEEEPTDPETSTPTSPDSRPTSSIDTPDQKPSPDGDPTPSSTPRSTSSEPSESELTATSSGSRSSE